MLLAVLSDQVLLAIVSGVFTLLGAIFTGTMGYFMQRLVRQGAEAAVKVVQVEQTLRASSATTDRKLDEGLKIQRATHTLVNKETADKLKKILNRSEMIYELKPTKENLSVLEHDKQMLAEHMKNQSIVDDEFGTEAAKDMGTERRKSDQGVDDNTRAKDDNTAAVKENTAAVERKTAKE